MNIQKIQHALQLWRKENNISSIYYLSDYFKKHFVIVHGGCAYETTIKSYPKVYLEYNNGISITDEKDFVIKDSAHSSKDDLDIDFAKQLAERETFDDMVKSGPRY